MGNKDIERHEESKAEGLERMERKKEKHAYETDFEKLKAEKFGKKEEQKPEITQLEWIELNKQLHLDPDTGKPYNMSAGEKSKQVFYDHPMVPIGMFATTFALCMGLQRFVTGHPTQTFWMWARIGGQGTTVAAMLWAAYATAMKQDKNKNAVSTHNS